MAHANCKEKEVLNSFTPDGVYKKVTILQEGSLSMYNHYQTPDGSFVVLLEDDKKCRDLIQQWNSVSLCIKDMPNITEEEIIKLLVKWRGNNLHFQNVVKQFMDKRLENHLLYNT